MLITGKNRNDTWTEGRLAFYGKGTSAIAGSSPPASTPRSANSATCSAVHPQSSRPSFEERATAALLLATRSFAMAFLMWKFTVFAEIERIEAISSLAQRRSVRSPSGRKLQPHCDTIAQTLS
nr:hypothetical protein [Variovorax sp. CF079]